MTHACVHNAQVLSQAGSYIIQKKTDCAFEMKALPSNHTPSADNAGSCLSLKGIFECGSFLVIAHRVKYQFSDTHQGLYPQKPGLFLKQPMRVENSKMYRLL